MVGRIDGREDAHAITQVKPGTEIAGYGELGVVALARRINGKIGNAQGATNLVRQTKDCPPVAPILMAAATAERFCPLSGLPLVSSGRPSTR